MLGTNLCCPSRQKQQLSKWGSDVPLGYTFRRNTKSFPGEAEKPQISPAVGRVETAWAHTSDGHTTEWAALPTTLPQWTELICPLTAPHRHRTAQGKDHPMYMLVVESRQERRRKTQSKQSENLWNAVLQHIPWRWPYWELYWDWDTVFCLDLLRIQEKSPQEGQLLMGNAWLYCMWSPDETSQTWSPKSYPESEMRMAVHDSVSQN